MIVQRMGKAYCFLLSTKDLKKRKVFILEGETWTEIPTGGMTVNYIRARNGELFFNDLSSGRLFRYDHRKRSVVRVDLEPFRGAYYAFGFLDEALFHLYNSGHLIIVKSTLAGKAIFRSIDCIAARTPIAHILSIQAVATAGKAKLILADAGRKSVHMISI
jgi:hypothetical protein